MLKLANTEPRTRVATPAGRRGICTVRPEHRSRWDRQCRAIRHPLPQPFTQAMAGPAVLCVLLCELLNEVQIHMVRPEGLVDESRVFGSREVGPAAVQLCGILVLALCKVVV